MQDISVRELKERIDNGDAPRLIDVRETWEYENDHIDLDGTLAENIPMGVVPVKIEELKSHKDQELIVCCRSGGRSGNITMFLRQQGFSNVRNLIGGMLAWKAEIDPSFNVE